MGKVQQRVVDAATKPPGAGLDQLAAGGAAALPPPPLGGPRVISSQPAWKQQLAAQAAMLQAAAAADDDLADDGASGAAGGSGWAVHVNSGSIYSLYYSPLRTSVPDGETGLLAEAPKLLVATPLGAAVVDTFTYDVMQVHHFGAAPPAGGAGRGRAATAPGRSRSSGHAAASNDSSSSSGAGGGRYCPQPEVDPPGHFAFGLAPDGACIHCCTLSASGGAVAVLSLTPVPDQGMVAIGLEAEAEAAARFADYRRPGVPAPDVPPPPPVLVPADQQRLLSVFQSGPLPESSPLRVTYGPHSASSASSSTSSPARGGAARGSSGGSARARSAGSAASPSKNGGKGGLMNHPVTFHKKVKSSGYGFVQGPIKLGRPPPAPVKVNSRPPLGGGGGGKGLLTARAYPTDAGPPVQHQPQHALPGNAPTHSGAVVRLAFSPDASRLLTASADKTARAMRLPLSRRLGDGTDFIGHNAALHCAAWSHDGSMVLTASADRSARMWHAGCATPLLEFTHVNSHVPKLATPVPGGSVLLTPGKAAAAAASSKAAEAANPAFLHGAWPGRAPLVTTIATANDCYLMILWHECRALRWLLPPAAAMLLPFALAPALPLPAPLPTHPRSFRPASPSPAMP